MDCTHHIQLAYFKVIWKFAEGGIIIGGIDADYFIIYTKLIFHKLENIVYHFFDIISLAFHFRIEGINNGLINRVFQVDLIVILVPCCNQAIIIEIPSGRPSIITPLSPKFI